MSFRIGGAVNAAWSAARPRASSDLALLDHKVVHVTTWVASVFAVGLATVGVASGSAEPLEAALNPAVVAVVGWIMLIRNRPSVAVQILSGMAGMGIAVGLLEVGPGLDPMLGILAMGVAGVLFARRYVALYATVAAIAVAAAGYARASGFDPAVRIQATMGAAGTFAFLAWLGVWMKRHWLDGQRQLRELIQSKDQLVASVSHELRTPMTSVVGIARELDERFDDFEYEEVRELVALIVHESTDVANILEDLLVAARSDVGTLSLDLQSVDIYDEINSALATISAATLARHHRTETLAVHADAGRVRQILRNLVVNASRYGGPAVRVAVRRKGENVLVDVCDDGDPISADDGARIFEPFQGVAGSHHVPGSVGLGLTVSRQLAWQMGGDLVYAHNGTEAVFTLTLPAADPRRELPTHAAETSAAPLPAAE